MSTKEKFDIQEYMTKGVELITRTAYEGDQQIKINPWDVAVLEY